MWTALRAHGRRLELLGRDPSRVMVEAGKDAAGTARMAPSPKLPRELESRGRAAVSP